MTGSSGRSSIPETPENKSSGRGVLDRPVKQDDDRSFVEKRNDETIHRRHRPPHGLPLFFISKLRYKRAVPWRVEILDETVAEDIAALPADMQARVLRLAARTIR